MEKDITEEEKIFRDAADICDRALQEKMDEIRTATKDIPNWIVIAMLEMLKAETLHYINCQAEGIGDDEE